MKTLKKDTSFKEEFKSLFNTYYGPFCIYANRFVHDEDVSKDIVSDVFATFWQEQNKLVIKKETALAYIKTCVKHKAFNYLKHQNYEWAHINFVLDQPTHYADAPDKLYNLEELYDLLNATLQKLPYEYREVFIQSIIKKRPHEEIAEKLKISLRSVNRYKQHVLSQLKLDLKDYLPVAILLLGSIDKNL